MLARAGSAHGDGRVPRLQNRLTDPEEHPRAKGPSPHGDPCVIDMAHTECRRETVFPPVIAGFGLWRSLRQVCPAVATWNMGEVDPREIERLLRLTRVPVSAANEFFAAIAVL